MRPVDPAGPLGPIKSFFALKATGNVSLVGIDGFDASVQNATVEINKGTPSIAGGVARAVNFKLISPDSNLPIRAGPNPADQVVLDYSGTLFRAAGFVKLTIGEFVSFSGNLAFEKGETVTGRVNGATADQTFTVLKIGASNVNVFVGMGGPYWTDSNGDGVITSADTPLSAGATGLALGGVEFALALFKPTTAGSRNSFYALKAQASSVSLVGLPGVTISATGLTVEVNGASGPLAAGQTVLPVLNLSGARAVTVRTGPNPTDTETLDFAGALLRVTAHVALGISDGSLSGDISFEQTTRTNGTKVIKIAVTALTLEFGAPDNGFKITGASGLIFVTNLGMAAEFSVPVSFAFGGNALAFTGTLSLGINNTNVAVDETFDIGGGQTQRLQLQKGPYLRLAGTQINITMLGNTRTAPRSRASPRSTSPPTSATRPSAASRCARARAASSSCRQRSTAAAWPAR
jgi:hypothetical protein